MKPLCIIGAGWHGREVLVIWRSLPLETYAGERYPVVFYDEHKTGEVDGVPIVRKESCLLDHDFIVAIGDNERRTEIFKTVLANGGTAKTIIHRSAVLWSDDIGAGTVIFPNAIVSVAAKVGRFCIINKHATVGHGAVMEDGANVADGVVFSGRLGAKSFMGLNSVAIPGVDIGAGCTIGAGSVVTKNVPDGETWVGVPARPVTRPISNGGGEAFREATGSWW